MTSHNAPRTWTKNYRNGFGSAERIQRNAYAYRVMLAMTDGREACPACDTPFNAGDFEVDRIFGGEQDENGSEIYREGSIVYICKGCNQGRSSLQSLGYDWTFVTEYQNDVIAASADVEMPTIKEARAWWNNRNTGQGRTSRYA